ncbi:CLUMA_CG003154, isoform A [Clunio marinus]|uniref:CLUMA_CG003154, isoform A n=1 Tax=Clunio marinus TaxID=568069 RepID=A0A1J1HPT2_9DIPT|nr:CLUMA_CG003154, isoform A [Clunio marinus]
MSCNIYYENNKVNFLVIQQHVLKVFDCGINKIIFLLTKNNDLLISKSQSDNNNSLTTLKEGVKDAAYSYPMFYIVDSNGDIFKTNVEQINENRWDRIESEFKIQEISVNGDGVLMISEDRELIGMGDFENVIKADEPTKIECFSNFNILQVCTGDNFAIVLVQQKLPVDDNRNSFHEDTFIERTKQLGCSILKTQVWSFGSINKGLLGTGDHIKRSDTAVVVKLADIGVNKIFCGSHHAAALTLDGRLYLWGFNDYQQISLDPNVSDLSAPTEFKSEINGKISKNVLAVACGLSSTVILLNDLTFRILGRNGSQDQNEEFASEIKYEHDAGSQNQNNDDQKELKSIPYVVSHGKVLLVNRKNIPMFLLNYFTDEQKMVKTMINAQLKYVKPLRNFYEETSKLIEAYENLVYVSIVNLQTCFDYLTMNCEHLLENTIVNVHFTEIIREFHRYLRHVCDIRSFYSLDHYSKSIERKILKIVLEKPFSCLETFEKQLDLIYDLHLYNNPNILASSVDNAVIEELKCQTVERKKAIKDFVKTTIPLRIKEADDTYTFWQLLNESQGKFELHSMERRFILDSQSIALKLHDRTNIFSSNRFILFNDYLVCLLNRPELIPIHLVWIQSFNTQSTAKFSFKIVTPESHHKVYALTSNDRNEWQTKIRDCVWRSLRINRGSNQALPLSRYGSYKFSEKNPKYPNYEVEGRWFEGKFHDLCHIRIPSINRIFKCRISKSGEVNGCGLVEDDTFIYHGDFLQGKLHGYGSWRSKSKGTNYQGFFKYDKFHGFGILSNTNSAYYGEFVSGVRHGYGVEDDGITGNKYIGMWQDGKRHGAGILITMDGSYFEGIFTNNNLSGDGLAIFPNGSYYIGEVTVNAPSGNGLLHLPDAEIIEEIMELDDGHLKMKGNVLKGVLGGTWDKIAITNGNLLMNEIFLKTPNSSNYLKIKPEKKWSTIFDNWRESVFGTTTYPEQLGIHDRWNRVSIYMTRKKNFENDVKKNFSLMVRESSSESLELDEQPLTNYQQQPITNFGRSNSSTELYMKESSNDFDTTSLRSFSEYSIADSIINASKKSQVKSVCELDFVPSFVNSTFDTLESIEELKEYFQTNIANDQHPLSSLVRNIQRSFCASYGNWKCKPTSILSKIAMAEWISIIKRVYMVLRLFFPGLPPCNNNDDNKQLNGYEEKDENCKLLAPLNFMHQLLLNDEIYSCFFLLYASKSSKQDELYSQRLMTCEKKTNEELRNLLKIEPYLIPLLEDAKFYEAIRTFKRLSEKYCPSEMLEVIRDTYQLISDCAAKISTRGDLLSADNLLAITIYLIIKANINHLGAELSLLTDLMEDDFEKLINMEQYIYTTVKIGYLHTISTRFFHN